MNEISDWDIEGKPKFERMARILDAVAAERLRQEGRWGVQDHPPNGARRGFTGEGLRSYYAALADLAKRNNDARVKAGTLGWDNILLEEVYEALAESDPKLRVAELIQVAAVALAEVDMHVRNEGRGVLA